MTFCVTKWFRWKSHFKRKNIIKEYKKSERTHVCFPFHTVGTWEVLVLDGLLSSVFVISPRKKAPASHFYNSQHLENGRERSCIKCVCSFRKHILTFQDLFTFTKEILKENITSCSVCGNKTSLCLESCLRRKVHIFERFWKYHIFERFRLWFWYIPLLLFNPFSLSAAGLFCIPFCYHPSWKG